MATKLWINGRVSEDRDEWTEEVRAQCQRCYDDKKETSEVQAERIRHQRRRGDSLAALQDRRVQITVDRVLSAGGKMKKKQSQRPRQLLGDKDAAMLADGECVRSHALVRDAFQRIRSSPRGAENSSLCVLVTMLARARACEFKILRLAFRPECARENVGNVQDKDSSFFAHQVEEDVLADVGRHNLEDYDLGYLRRTRARGT